MLLARPAAGKSEIIDFLKKTSPSERVERFHVELIDEIDDFPMLWVWFEEDQILESLGKPHIYTDKSGYFLFDYFWNVLIRRIDLEYKKKLRDNPGYHKYSTTLIEFSRGKEHGGYREAFQHISKELWANTAILYLDVPWEESMRKNRARFNPERPDSILQHGLEDQKMEKLYKETDWVEVTAADPQYLTVHGVRVPYVVFPNADDVTSGGGEALGQRLEDCLSNLWKLYQAR
jgi:hypothetical protein